MSSRRSIAIAFTLTAMALDFTLPSTVEPEWRWGIIERGSVRTDADGAHFRLSGSRQEVVYPGALPDDVCPGADAVVEGVVDGAYFVASTVARPICSKGNECRPYECLPIDQRPEPCRVLHFE